MSDSRNISRLTATSKQLKWKCNQRKCYFNQQNKQIESFENLNQAFLPYSCRHTCISIAAASKQITLEYIWYLCPDYHFSGTGCCYDTVDSRHKIQLTADSWENVIRLTVDSEAFSWVHSCYYDDLLQRLKHHLLRSLIYKAHGALVLVGMRVSVYSNLFLKHWHSYIPSNQSIHLSAWHEHLHTLHIHLLTWRIILHNRHIYSHTLHVHIHICTYNYSSGTHTCT